MMKNLFVGVQYGVPNTRTAILSANKDLVNWLNIGAIFLVVVIFFDDLSEFIYIYIYIYIYMTQSHLKACSGDYRVFRI